MKSTFLRSGLVLLLFLSCLSSRFIPFRVLAAEADRGRTIAVVSLYQGRDEQLGRERLEEKRLSVEMPVTVPVKLSDAETGAELFLLLVVVFRIFADRFLIVSMTSGFLRLLRCGQVPFRNRTSYWRKTSFTYGRMFI